MKIRLGIGLAAIYQYVIILLLVLLSDTVAVTLKDFPEYVHRMKRKDYGKKCMLANEYEVSKNLLLKTLENDFILSYAELSPISLQCGMSHL